MRILFVISGLGLGGAERQVVLLAKQFARIGHGVAIYALTPHTPRADEIAGTQIELVIDRKRMRLDLGVLFRLRRHISRWRPDVVHAFLFDGSIYARLACAGTGIPMLDSERSDNYSLSALQAVANRLTAGLLDGVVANSHAGAAFAHRLHRTPPEHVHVVWNGIDVAEIDGRMASAPQLASEIWPGHELRRACVVGSIWPAKDYPLALGTFRCLLDADPDWRLICVGDELPEGRSSDHKALVLAERRRLNLEPYIKFVGHRRDVLEMIASCDVLLVTSRHEGFPNVVLEAMSCGTPVASTDYSDVRRILPMAWQVVASRNPAELAAAVVRCCTERREVVAAQRQWVLRYATASASASAMLSVYARYVNRASTESRVLR